MVPVDNAFGPSSAVVILEGINDLWDGTSTADIVGNLEQMTHVSQAADVHPILMTVLPVDRPVFSDVQAQVAALDTAIRAMPKHQGVTILDAASQLNRYRPLSALFRHADGREDGVHSNDASYRLLSLHLEPLSCAAHGEGLGRGSFDHDSLHSIGQ